MIRLVYVSNSPDTLSKEELISILRTNSEKNQREEITGLLVYEGGDFMQVLEGPEQRVNQLMERIKKGSQYGRVNVLLREEVEERYFPKWSMAFAAPQDLEPEDQKHLSDFLERGDLPESDESGAEAARQMLMAFRSTRPT